MGWLDSLVKFIAKNPKKTAALIGGVASPEVLARYNNDNNVGWINGNWMPAFTRSIWNADTYELDYDPKYAFSTLMGAGASAALAPAVTKIPGSSQIIGAPAGKAVYTGITASIVEPMVQSFLDNHSKNAEAQSIIAETNKKQLQMQQQAEAPEAMEGSSSKWFNYLMPVIGAAGLGLGGYALYKYLTEKKESTNSPRAKMKLKGKEGDPYDDIVVDVPLHDMNISKAMSRGVNRGVRKIIHTSNKFSSNKKDPYTGKLIPYEEYVEKYGDPDDKDSADITQVGQTSEYHPKPFQKTASTLGISNKQWKKIKKKYEDMLTAKGIGTGIGATLGGLGGYIFGSQAFNGPNPSDYSLGLINSSAGVAGAYGGGLLGKYITEKWFT